MRNFLILIIAVLSLNLFSCTQDFEDINTNKNEPTTVTGDLLLPTVIFNVSNLLIGQAYDLGEIISQYGAYYEFNQVDIYNWTSDDRFWGLYRILQDIKDIKQFGVENDLPQYEGVALVMEVFAFSILTDAYGDVPYLEANQAEQGIISPVYDKQEMIYNGLLASLERANSIIDVNSELSGDILYDGDLSKWKKFANSLTVRLLMRISNVRDVKVELQKIVDNPTDYPIFESNDDEAIYEYSGIQPNIPPIAVGIGREYEYFLGVPTTHLVNLLLANNDPRIEEWLDEKVNDDGTLEYVGVLPGQNLGDIGRPKEYARKDISYFSDPTKAESIFLTFSELNFLLAEAAERGIIQAEAKGYYDAGVAASFQQWGVTMPEDFTTTQIPYEKGNLDRIYEQKWLALYHSGTEAWFDWKRTRKPDFIKAGPGNINNNLVPVRLMYPSLEQSVNASNYQAAVTSIGADDINTRVWWDK
jgi:hypothetical protein